MSILNSSIVPVGSTGGYEIDNSLRFNSSDSAYLGRTPSSAGNRKTWTLSMWVKRGSKIGSYEWLFSANNNCKIAFNGDQLHTYIAGFGEVTSSAQYRDPSAWYHIMWVVDTTQATASNRSKLYVNGSQITDLVNTLYPSQNFDTDVNNTVTHYIGQSGNSSYPEWNDGYKAEVNFVDGQALTPADFGEIDEDYGHWKPKAYEGTYGTNGFYLDFLGNSVPVITDSSSTSALTINTGITHSSTQQKFGATSIKLVGGSNGNADSGYGIEYAGTSNNCPTGANNITFETWIHWDRVANITLWHGHQFDWYMPLLTLAQADGKVSYGNQSHGGSNYIQTVTSVGVTANTWTHIAVTISNKTVKIYLDGVERASRTYTTGTWGVPTGSQMIGAGGTPYVDEIRISNSIRYTGTFTPPTAVFTDDANTTLLIHSDFAANTSLGADNSPNNNHWTPNNLSATDQMLDSPTNNFCTLNPLDHDALTFSEGNLTVTSTANDRAHETRGTIALTGKHYWEVVRQDTPGEQGATMGVASIDIEFTTNDVYIGYYPSTSGIYGDGQHRNGSSTTVATYTAQSAGSIMMFAYDADTGKFWIGKDGTWFNSGVPASGTGQVSVVPNYATKTYSPAVTAHNNVKVVANFGQDSSFAGNKTAQGNADDNGYGDFYYTPPTGYLALCTQNLPEPTVVPSEHFNTVLWNGDSNTPRGITGVGFQPDFVWTKTRSQANDHSVFDAVRGASKRLATNGTKAEYNPAAYGDVSSFDSDGFTVDNGTGGSLADEHVNESGETYVAWNWKANGAGVSNTNGTITSTVSANVDAGFSIVSWVANGTAGSTIGHGLTVVPEMMIVKSRDQVGTQWIVYYGDNTDYLRLQGTNATTDDINAWNDTSPTSSVFSVGGNGGDTNNTSGGNMIGYMFHSVDGYSKVGSYTGNGSTDGTFVHCGFRPRYIMNKVYSTTGSWLIWDSVRDTYNVINDGQILANSSDAEGAASWGNNIDIVSNGFKFRGSDNTNFNHTGLEYIYLAFAEHPFKYTNAR